MIARRSLLFAAGALALGPAARAARGRRADAIGYSGQALQVLARARAATGGSGWNFLRGWHETGHDGATAYEAWLDPVRYGLRLETHEPAGLRVRGFNGGGAWEITPAGAVTGTADPGPVGLARTEAFFRTAGWIWPGRFDAHGGYLGVRRSEGRAFEVVQVQPWGGQPRELWFDARSHLLARLVDPAAPAAATRFSDYRKVGPVRVAFRAQGPDGALRQVESLTFTPADRTLFSLPRSALARA